MTTERTAWHVLFAALIKERAPPDIVVVVEHVLSLEPQRADLLLIRRPEISRHDDEARVLRRLWPLLTADTLVEFKSCGRPTRRGDWIRLLGYGAQHHAQQIDRLKKASDLTLTLVVPTVTPTLSEEIASLGWWLEDLGGGYLRVLGGNYPGLLAVLADVAEAERDDLLTWFATAKLTGTESRRWVGMHTNESLEGKMQLKDLEGYDEILRSLLDSIPPEQRLAGLAPEQRLAGLAPEQRLAGLAPEQRLAGLAPEQRLAGLAPEQRLAGLAPEETILALPDSMLRLLSPEILSKLPPAVQAEVRRRLGR